MPHQAEPSNTIPPASKLVPSYTTWPQRGMNLGGGHMRLISPRVHPAYRSVFLHAQNLFYAFSPAHAEQHASVLTSQDSWEQESVGTNTGSNDRCPNSGSWTVVVRQRRTVRDLRIVHMASPGIATATGIPCPVANKAFGSFERTHQRCCTETSRLLI